MTLETSNFDFVQSSKVQLEVVLVHGGPHMHVGRPIHHPQKLCDFVLKVIEVVVEPISYSETPQIVGWVDAMEQEMKLIHKNNTWTLVDLQVSRKPITIKWVYKIKTHADGSTTKFKVQLVGQGFQQRVGEDFDETYVPVAKYNTLHTITTIVSHRSWPIFHFDIKITLLNIELSKEMFIKQPKGFRV
jgi:hypothetical protein